MTTTAIKNNFDMPTGPDKKSSVTPPSHPGHPAPVWAVTEDNREISIVVSPPQWTRYIDSRLKHYCKR